MAFQVVGVHQIINGQKYAINRHHITTFVGGLVHQDRAVRVPVFGKPENRPKTVAIRNLLLGAVIRRGRHRQPLFPLVVGGGVLLRTDRPVRRRVQGSGGLRQYAAPCGGLHPQT